MSDPLIGPVAHGLLNTAATVEGLVARARRLLEGADPSTFDEAVALLELAEANTAAMTGRLRRLAIGITDVLDLDQAPLGGGASDAPAATNDSTAPPP